MDGARRLRGLLLDLSARGPSGGRNGLRRSGNDALRMEVAFLGQVGHSIIGSGDAEHFFPRFGIVERLRKGAGFFCAPAPMIGVVGYDVRRLEKSAIWHNALPSMFGREHSRGPLLDQDMSIVPHLTRTLSVGNTNYGSVLTYPPKSCGQALGGEQADGFA
jgi:hypothetical protein